MKIAVVFIILLLILLPVLGVSTTGDETLKGRLQTFISYGLSLTSFLLCLLTIAISIYTVTNDIKEKQIFTVITKPIRRFEFLTGKLLGVILLDIILLCVFSSVIWFLKFFVFERVTSLRTPAIECESRTSIFMISSVFGRWP